MLRESVIQFRCRARGRSGYQDKKCTPHIIFDELSLRSAVPLIDIVEVTCPAAQAAGLRRVALFGTRFTMEGSFYLKRFSDWEIQLVVPDATEQAYIHDKYA